MSLHLIAHAGAGVADGQPCIGARLDQRVAALVFLVQSDDGGLDDQNPASGHGVAGIDREVHQHLLGQPRVDPYRGQPRAGQGAQLNVLSDQACQHLVHARNQLVQVDQTRLDDLSARKGQQLPGQPGRTHGRIAHLAQQLLGLIIATQPLTGQLQVAQDGGQQVVEVVGHAAGQPADGFHLHRMLQLLLQSTALRLGAPPLGNVTGDAHECGRAIQFGHAHGQVDRVGATVLPPLGPLDPHKALGDHLALYLGQLLACLRRHDLDKWHAQQFLARVPELAAGRVVDLD